MPNTWPARWARCPSFDGMGMRRKLAHTAALAVGEGKGELALLNHIKTLYLSRGCGITLKVQGGYGKGGKGVIDYAERISAGADYDRRIVLLDTDTDWNDYQRARAAKAGFDVVESAPCLEAWLLAIHGERRERNSDQHKRAFARRFGREAHDDRVYTDNFPRELLDDARSQVVTLTRLLDLIGV